MPPSPPHWTPQEEDVFIAHLEEGYTPQELTEVHNRTVEELMLKVIDLFSKGDVIVLSAATLDAILRRSYQ